MSEDSKKEFTEKDINQLKQAIAGRMLLAEQMQEFTRTRILLLLWAYKEQSVKELCEKLGKSWPTVNRHLVTLEKAGILDTREEISPGPKNKKIYSLKPNILMKTRTSLKEFRNIPSKDLKELLIRGFQSDSKTINIVKKVFDDIINYFEDLQRKIKEIDPSDFDNFRDLGDFLLRRRVSYYIEALDDVEFEFYMNEYHKLYNKLVAFREKRLEETKGEKVSRPFLAFHSIIPIKKIQEARFNRFWD